MSVFYFLLLVGALVLVHELGHFIAAKILDIKVLRFSIGYGKALVRKQIGETVYQIAILPVGGYVRILAEERDTADPRERRRALSARPLWQRVAVAFAGPAANLLLPIFIYFVFFAGQTARPAAVVGDVLDGAAARAGILPGDKVLEIDGQAVRYWEDIEDIVQSSPGRELHVRFSRNGKVFERYITPLADTVRRREDGTVRVVGRIGVAHAPFVPIIGVLDQNSPAAHAGLRTGDLVVSIDGQPVQNWTELETKLRRSPRRTNIVFFRSTEMPGAPQVRLLSPGFADLVPESRVDEKLNRHSYSGIERAEMFVAKVDAASPAEDAGLRAGDLIIALDDKPMIHWVDLEQRLLTEPEKAFRLTWKRWQGGQLETMNAELTQQRRRARDAYDRAVTAWNFGAHNHVIAGNGAMTAIDGRVTYALGRALERTGETIRTMVTGFVHIVSGDRPTDALGGPLMMYRITSASGHQGWDRFFLMMALISVNLALLNLLPVPMLDGGHLLVFAIEAVRRKPITTQARERIALAGFIVIIVITLLASGIDVMR